MKKQYTKKLITEAIAYWKKQLKKINESIEGRNYPTFVSSISELAESDSLNEGDPANVDYIALENQSPLGKIAFALLLRFLIKRGGNKITSAQFASCKSMKKLLASLRIEFNNDIDNWMNDNIAKNRQPMAILQNDLKDALNNKSTCFVIMGIKPGYNPNDYDDDTRLDDNQAAAMILNDLCGATGLRTRNIPSGLLLSNGSQYVIAAF